MAGLKPSELSMTKFLFLVVNNPELDPFGVGLESTLYCGINIVCGFPVARVIYRDR
jgi:hypothetical protein